MENLLFMLSKSFLSSKMQGVGRGLETLTDPSLFLVLGFEGGNDFRVPVSEGGNYFRVLGFEGGNDFRVPVSEGGNVHDPSRAAQTSLTLKSFLLRRWTLPTRFSCLHNGSFWNEGDWRFILRSVSRFTYVSRDTLSVFAKFGTKTVSVFTLPCALFE